MRLVDKHIGKSLLNMHKHSLGIEKSELSFTLPGYYNIELIPNGKNIMVTSENAEEYANIASSSSLRQELQIRAFKKGLESMIPVNILSIFYYKELDNLLCGENESNWDIEILNQHIIPAQGYTTTSKTFCNFLTVLSTFTKIERTNFLEFVTGFPRLPIGGFEKLAPKLSVVKKDVNDDTDSCLPSVMTCKNYLKVPDYTNIDALKKNLLYAISEGRHAFHLS